MPALTGSERPHLVLHSQRTNVDQDENQQRRTFPRSLQCNMGVLKRAWMQSSMFHVLFLGDLPGFTQPCSWSLWGVRAHQEIIIWGMSRQVFNYRGSEYRSHQCNYCLLVRLFSPQWGVIPSNPSNRQCSISAWSALSIELRDAGFYHSRHF